MSNNHPNQAIGIREWVDKAHGISNHQERQATELFLSAVSSTPTYRDKLYLKGGLLMGLAYGSPRHTADIDLTTTLESTHEQLLTLKKELNRNLRRASTSMNPDLVCSIQTVKPQPKSDTFEQSRFPALKVTIAYATRDSRNHNKLLNGECPNVLNVDISYHEPIYAVEFIPIDANSSIAAYSLTDVIAEKLRALLQQVSRRRCRQRRQDIYDIDFLVQSTPLDDADRSKILCALKEKAQARDIEPHPDSLSDPEIRKRAEQEWYTLELEIDDLPTFATTYDTVENFYRSLPW